MKPQAARLYCTTTTMCSCAGQKQIRATPSRNSLGGQESVAEGFALINGQSRCPVEVPSLGSQWLKAMPLKTQRCLLRHWLAQQLCSEPWLKEGCLRPDPPRTSVTLTQALVTDSGAGVGVVSSADSAGPSLQREGLQSGRASNHRSRSCQSAPRHDRRP